MARLEMPKNGAARGRANELPPECIPQYTPERVRSFANWAQLWTLVLATKAEAQLWLRANLVPLVREVDNPDDSRKTKLRPIALLETETD